MRDMTENAPALPTTSDIAEKARDFPFLDTVGRLALTAVLSVFVTAGWLAGSTWFGVVFTILWTGHHARWAYDAMVYGFRLGSKAKTEKKT